MYERFQVDVKVNNEPAVAYYAFCEAPKAFLDTPIPQEALNSIYGVSEGVPNKTDVVLRDFCLGCTDMGDTVIVHLAAQFAPTYRTRVVNEQDLAEWEAYLTPYGFDSSKWMNLEEYKTRVAEATSEEI